MKKSVVIIGAESTGKTTLCQRLTEFYDEPMSEEYVRHYVDTVKRPLTHKDLEPIAQGQIAAENKAHQIARKIVLHDTNILSSIIYAKHFFEQIVPYANHYFKTHTYNLYLLCLPDIPWVEDKGQRESPETRDKFHQIFKSTLIKEHLPFTEIGGDSNTRFESAKFAIDQIARP